MPPIVEMGLLVWFVSFFLKSCSRLLAKKSCKFVRIYPKEDRADLLNFPFFFLETFKVRDEKNEGKVLPHIISLLQSTMIL